MRTFWIVIVFSVMPVTSVPMYVLLSPVQKWGNKPVQIQIYAIKVDI